VSDRAPDVVFVSSLGHSGSTVLERALATHPVLLGLGEVHQLLRTLDDRADVDGHPCGCGLAAADCPLWSTVLPQLRASRRDPVERYRIVLDGVRELMGPSCIPVDSSKSTRAMRDLLATGVRVHAVDLVRDVRSWTVAMRDRAARRWAAGVAARPTLWSRAGLAGTPIGLFRTWDTMNVARKAQLASSRVPVVPLGYEPFTADPGRELARVLDQLGLDAAGVHPDGSLAAATVHTIFGNNMKLSPELTGRVVGDTRWLSRRDWELAAVLLPGTMRRNRAWVHEVGDPAAFSG
jgi:hypothetical protein